MCSGSPLITGTVKTGDAANSCFKRVQVDSIKDTRILKDVAAAMERTWRAHSPSLDRLRASV